jgi:cell division protein FtsW (lipid II flippase)
MNLKTAYVLLVLVVALITVPIIWLVIQASESVPFLIPIIILGLVIVSVIISKTGYKPSQQPDQHRGSYTVSRIIRALASGAATMFVVGFITVSFIRPLLPNYFWYIYLVILFALGVIIGDTLQRMLQKKHD